MFNINLLLIHIVTYQINFDNGGFTRSRFDLRTWDLEGSIFYAQTHNYQDWFLLALRNGQLEVQVKNRVGPLVIKGGPFVSDGNWHAVSISSSFEGLVEMLFFFSSFSSFSCI
uniref:Laminin G domain-containing protein n=1 Tax=Eptatretus burgeri TaxID=7764 RepID=A0A8C4QEI9_EPTBU